MAVVFQKPFWQEDASLFTVIFSYYEPAKIQIHPAITDHRTASQRRANPFLLYNVMCFLLIFCLFVFGFYSEVSKCDIMIHLFFCDVATVIPGQLLHHKLVIFYFTQTQYSPILRRHQLYNFTLQQIHSSVLIPTKTVTVLHCSDNKQQLFTRLNQSAREKSIKTLITLFMFINRSICLTAQITN